MGDEVEVHHLAVMSCGGRRNWSVSVQVPNPVVVWGLILPDGEVLGLVVRLFKDTAPFAVLRFN